MTKANKNGSEAGGQERTWAESPWNEYVDRLLAEEGLTLGELRAALAFARNIIGFNAAEARLGGELLKDTAGMKDSRSWDRAVEGDDVTVGLVGRELLEIVERGRQGRGGRGLYRLPVTHLLNAAEERHFENAAENAAVARPRSREEVQALKAAAPASADAHEGSGGGSPITSSIEGVPQAVADAIEGFAPSPEDLAVFIAAHAKSPKGFKATAAKVRKDHRAGKVRRPASVLVHRLNDRDHLRAVEAERPKLTTKQWVVATGYQFDEAELAERLGRDFEVTGPLKNELMDMARNIRANH